MENANLKLVQGKKSKQKSKRKPNWQKFHVFREPPVHPRKKAIIEAQIETKINEILEKNKLKSQLESDSLISQGIEKISNLPNTSSANPILLTNIPGQHIPVTTNQQQQKDQKIPGLPKNPSKPDQHRNLKEIITDNKPQGPLTQLELPSTEDNIKTLIGNPPKNDVQGKKKQTSKQKPNWQKFHVFRKPPIHPRNKAIIEAQIETKINEIREKNKLKSQSVSDNLISLGIVKLSNLPNTSSANPILLTSIPGQHIPVTINQQQQKDKKISGLPKNSSNPDQHRNLKEIITDNKPQGPLAQLEQSQTKHTTLPSTENSIETLVGNRSNNKMSQQKKILQFELKLQAMKQEQSKKEIKSISTDNTEMNTVMQSSTNVDIHTNIPQNKSAAKAPAPMKTDYVETVFSADNTEFYIEPEQIPQQPMKFPQANDSLRILRQSKQLSEAATPFKAVDPYHGYKYPKGIPKSFLLPNPQQTSTQLYNAIPPEMPPNPNYQVNKQYIENPLAVETSGQIDVTQPYSPSELYNDIDVPQGQDNEELESSELNQSGQKRLSAFQRLGPQTQPKKPKLTISVTVNDEQEVREVVDETEELEEITPVHLREDIILSTDETVMKYLKTWPWKRNVGVRKTVTARVSKTVMILEKEQMEEIYEKDTVFVQVLIKGYPPTWTKEQVLDLLMENMRGYSFIPCFIEFNREECKFLCLRCRSALLCLHKCGFIIRKDDVELIITLAQTELTLNQLDFVPRLVLRKRVHMCFNENTKLNLSAFTLKEDISHFIYFPLSRLFNQSELIQMQTEVKWASLTELDLSHNKIFSLEGFELEQTAPNLKHLNLSHNCIQRITSLLNCRSLPLKSIHLEGNPLCTDYTDPQQYVRVIKMMFPSVTVIDEVPVRLKGDMPKFIRNYCPEESKELVGKFLEIYFPLLDGTIEHRTMLKEMYEEDANLTITYSYKLTFSPIYRTFKSLFQSTRKLEGGKMTMVKGSSSIVKNIVSWPQMEHDPFTFTVDVLYHSDFTTILRVDGVLKLTRETLAEDEYLLPFSRTLVLHTRDCVEYKIHNETLFWSIPTEAYVKSAFAVTTLKTKLLNPKIDTTTDEKLQEELLKIFMKLTSMDKKISERCLEFKKWNLKEALDHFSKLLKLNSLEALLKDFS